MKDIYAAGIEGENIACAYLKGLGMTILQTRYRAAQGEIDIIVRDGRTTCFIEVKYRPTARLTEALLAVNQDKRRRIKGAAQAYMQQHHIKPPVRFDVIEITRAGVWYLKGDQVP